MIPTFGQFVPPASWGEHGLEPLAPLLGQGLVKGGDHRFKFRGVDQAREGCAPNSRCELRFQEREVGQHVTPKRSRVGNGDVLTDR